MDVYKYVTLTPTAGGQWSYTYGGPPQTNKANFVIDVPTGADPHWITFTIGGTNNLTFDIDDPIWANIDSKPLPTQTNHNNSNGQIRPQPFTNTKQLTVYDPNSNDPDLPPLMIYYRLNFTGDPQHTMFDPVIKNGGRTTRLPPGALEVATFAISVAVLVTLLFVAYQLVMLRKDLTPDPKRDLKRDSAGPGRDS